MIVGCYSVDLYCDNEGNCPKSWSPETATYTGETEGECLRQARRHGWLITRAKHKGERKAYCPKCSNKKTKRK